MRAERGISYSRTLLWSCADSRKECASDTAVGAWWQRKVAAQGGNPFEGNRQLARIGDKNPHDARNFT